MRGNRAWADPQRQCDLLVTPPGRQQPEHVRLATRELVPRPARRILRARYGIDIGCETCHAKPTRELAGFAQALPVQGRPPRPN
jgi:hypothetical protein